MRIPITGFSPSIRDVSSEDREVKLHFADVLGPEVTDFQIDSPHVMKGGVQEEEINENIPCRRPPASTGPR
jgi:hypothetical protein